ncbi:MAG: PAS domain-containing protein, partial [Herbaspirillum sp.]
MSDFGSNSNLDAKWCAESASAVPNTSTQLLAALQSALKSIVQDEPLDAILANIVRVLEDQQAGLQCAILLHTDDALGLRVAAAPSLPADYLHALEQLLQESDPHAMSEFLASPMAAQDIYATAFWPTLQQAAAQHGMPGCWALPLQSMTKGGLGLFVLHARSAGLSQADAEQAATAVLPLTLLAISHASETQAPRSSPIDVDSRIALALETSQIGIWDRLIPTGEVYYSGRWKALLGYSPAEDIGVRLDDAYKRIHPDDLSRIQSAMQAHFAGQTEDYSAEYRIRCKDNSYKWFLSRGRIVSRAPDGQPLRMVGAMADITERKRLELELQEWATTDFLTQLPNRRQFMVALDDALLRQKRSGRAAALVMCDLDYF